VAYEHHAPARFAAPPAGLDATRGVALYAQLAELWRYNIVSRKWPSGHRLDNFENLAAQYKVARITVRQAVARLVQEGLLSTQRGRGTFVLAPRGELAQERPRVGVDGAPDRLAIEILYNQPASALPSEFRGAFGAFDRYREITKLHRVGQLPFAMVRVFIADAIYRRFPARAIEHKKLLRLAFQHAGRAAEQMHQRMTIELADLVVSQHLVCSVGAPVAKILRQTYGADQRLSYAGISWYRGDAFEMDMTLPRGLVLDSSPALIAPAVRAKKPRS
jgi:GntR family transcriptional regulator